MRVELNSELIPIAFADPLALFIVRAGLMNEQAIKKAMDGSLAAQISLINYLVINKLVNCRALAQALAAYMKVDYFDLSEISQDHLIKDFIDTQFIREYNVLPLMIVKEEVYLAISEPKHLEALPELKFHTDLKIRAVVVDGDKLIRLIDAYLSEHQYVSLSKFTIALENPGVTDYKITMFVKQILMDAVKQRASDIHLEPYKTSYRIRLRIDGILHKMTLFSLEVAQRIIASIKVMAHIDIAERRLPQDGRFSLEMGPKTSRDCRVSTCPTLYGEKIVIRILDAENTSIAVEELGMEEQQYQQFITAIQRPQGMILVTGPTGSGKTATLYTAINCLNTLDKNILTVEEPVEIKLPGINQVNVNSKIDLSFSKVLKYFLRQDPDIIMIGEIRDKETANIALKAAQTGHLVLSTLHTNSAAETLLRLLMMDIAAFSIAHSLHLIIAQRLLRKLCQYCKKPRRLAADELRNLNASVQTNLNEVFDAVGCDQCNKGYKGRLAVFEMLPVAGEIARLLANTANARDIEQCAQQAGYINLYQAALNKVAAGLTSLAEVRRVIV